jgi:16S rRNA (adenine1518-N6/adenine1519-N6)-dimethyltransferase
VFTLQDEMARRLSASPGSDDYGALTVRMQRHFRVEYLRKISGNVFFPQPDVDSAVVRITPRNQHESQSCPEDIFQEIVRTGFSQRRKQLRKLLGTDARNWEEAAHKIGVPVTARAEELSREHWIALANLLRSNEEEPASPTAEEHFPVVDEGDRKIGTAKRAEVHGNNLRHRAVHILVFNAAGELLLQKRSALKDRHPLRWDSSAAGHVEDDESYDETASRELKEELGIQTALEGIGKLPASDKTGQEFIFVYRARHEGPFRFPLNEIQTVKFFPAGIIERWIANKPEDFAPGFLECWKLLS